MRICIITMGEPLPLDSGWTKTRSMGYLADKAVEEGHCVDWISPSFDHITKKHRKPSVIPYNIRNCYRVFVYKSFAYKKNISLMRLLFFFANGRKIKRLLTSIEKPDIVIVPLEYLPYLHFLPKYCLKKSITLIPDLLDMWDMIYGVFPTIFRPLLFFYKLFMESGHKYALNNTKGFIALSEPMRDWCKKYLNRRIEPRTDRVFPLACEAIHGIKHSDEAMKFWSNLGISKSDFIIVFAGGLNRFVQMKDVYEASIKLVDNKNIKFVFCGGGSFFDYYSSLEHKNIVYAGQIGFEKVQALYSLSSLALIPYHDESFKYHAPNKFAEYLSAKLPILLLPSGYMSELISAYLCGMRYTNSDELTNSIMFFYNNREALRAYANNALKLFDEKFESNKIYDSMLKYFEEMRG